MTLADKIVLREAKVAMIGLGYVRLPLILAMAKAGFITVGVEINATTATQINAGCSYIEE